MIQAAIEASKQEVDGNHLDRQIGAYNDLSASVSHQRQFPLEDAELAQAVSLSLKTAEQEKALRERGLEVGPSDQEVSQLAEVEGLGKSAVSNGRLETGSSSIQDKAEDVEEQPLIRHRSKHMSSNSMEPAKEVGEAGPVVVRTPSGSVQQHIDNHTQANENAFHSDEWGGISSEEHDEAVMLEAAMLGGISADSNYGLPHAPHQIMLPALNSTVGSYSRQPRPMSPTLEAQRWIREQQDDEYLASLQADQEKESRAREVAEAHRSMELAAREFALKEERLKEEESRKKLEEVKEFERLLSAKEASLPPEPMSDDKNAVTLLVWMPDGTRCGRRFLKSDKLQVRPYPRRAFSDGEKATALNELGLTCKQEALFLEFL